MRHLWRRLGFYVLLATGLVAPAEPVTGPLNGRVTLPCTYSLAPTSMCWGQGSCPYSKCNDAIIWTDGHKVTWRKSDRYELLGNISHGDVSLTITGATKEDEGTYCCRVEIPGLFNDKIKEVTVQIHETTSPPEPTDQPFHTPHEFPLPTGSESPFINPKTTSANLIPFTTEQENQKNNEIEDTFTKPAYIVAGVVAVIILISLAALLYSYRHCKRKNKDISRSPAIVSLEGLERTQDRTEPNIYLID
ncbi:hepatitis A virus cellular receptor 1 homolog [Eleutherodactylus coqui]|uniref:hepatitis A virus cellular receptor 1 homolog n=1 Tax=Eleutherodactylus coqui TaxID=57060 RepID=UPI003462EDC9